MNKKFGLVITAGALSALLIVGSTLAWFTDRKEATNTFKMDNLAVDLLENGEVQDSGLDFPDLVPGATVTKEVTVQNTENSVSAYVRVALSIQYAIETEGPEDLILSDLVVLNTTDWVEYDGYYYYTKALAQGEESTPLFEKVAIPTEWTNEMEFANFEIDIVMEAIQSENLYTPGTDGFKAEELAALWN